MVEGMNVEQIDLKAPDVALMQEMGIREVTAATEPFEVEAGLEEPVRMFYKNAEGEIFTVMTRIIHQVDQEKSYYTLFHVKHNIAGSVSGSGGMLGKDDTNNFISTHLSQLGQDNLSVRCEAKLIDDIPRIKLSFSIAER
ncbi:MAG: hypothetical protein GY869_26005 [Planctomycetes bacterium]|nr:hypothetical protein [Planctomycetota bacterium]